MSVCREGPIQRDITAVVKGGHYAFEGDVRLLDEVVSKIWQKFKVIVTTDFVDGSQCIFVVSCLYSVQSKEQYC
jgi:hypothetical protein